MKILVTGATGFVGKNLISALNKKSYEINILTRKADNNPNSFIGDLSNKELLLEATKDIDIVIHIAGISSGNVFKVNHEGTKNLVNACVKNKIKKFIFISTYDVLTPTKYGKSKLLAENYLKESGLDYLIFRPTVIYGNNDNKNLSKLISLIKRLPLIPIPSNGKAKLQPLLVDDIVNIIIQSLESKKKNKTYFIGGPESLSFNEVIDIVSRFFSKKVYKIHIPKIILYLFRKDLLKDKTCSLDEIKKDFNFNPTSFERGIKLYF